MIVKHAKPENAQRVCELANILKIKQNDKSQNGFLIYPLNESGYQIRTKSKYFYIAEDNSKLDGFLMCYDSNTLNNYLKDGLLSHEVGLVGLYVGILHKPTKNQTSISFCNKIGFKEIAEVTNEDKTV